MVFCALGPIRLRSNSSIGSPNPLADWPAVRPATVAEPERRPIGAMNAPSAERPNSVKVCAQPASAMVASTCASAETTTCAGSNGFVFPLIELTMTGTALASDSVFQ